jgi:hypothetical protein
LVAGSNPARGATFSDTNTRARSSVRGGVRKSVKTLRLGHEIVGDRHVDNSTKAAVTRK